MKRWLIKLGIISTLLPALVMGGPETDSPVSPQGMQESTQDLKQKVLKLNRDLFLLEEELLFPSNTQVSVFVSMDVGEFFSLDAVQLQINGKEVSNYLYTRREIEALARGGVQRLHIGNLRTGEHEIVAYFSGKGPHGRDYRRGATANIKKGLGPKYIELRIVDTTARFQPEFEVKEW